MNFYKTESGAYIITNGSLDETEITKADFESEMQLAQKRGKYYERTRPLTAKEVTALIIKQQINTLSVDDNTALRMVEFYPEWAAGVSYTAGYKVQRCGKLWRCVQAHTSQAGWEPENASSLWTEICETHDGTIDDPIPYSGNMALEAGKYYIQSDKTYLCNRDTGNPVYHALVELVGLYVTEVTTS